MKSCPRCGTQYNDNVKFCPKCGCSISLAPEQAVQNNQQIQNTQPVQQAQYGQQNQVGQPVQYGQQNQAGQQVQYSQQNQAGQQVQYGQQNQYIQQSQYVQQVQPMQPGGQPPKKKKKGGCLVGIIIALLLLIGAGVGIFFGVKALFFDNKDTDYDKFVQSMVDMSEEADTLAKEGKNIQAQSKRSYAAASVASLRYAVEYLLWLNNEGSDDIKEFTKDSLYSGWNNIGAINYFSPFPYYFEGLIWEVQGNEEYAEASYKDAKVSPNYSKKDSNWFYLRHKTVKELYALRDDLRETEAKINKGFSPKIIDVKREPNLADSEILRDSCESLVGKKLAADAVKYAEAALNNDAGEVKNFVNAVECYMAAKNYSKAKECLKEGLLTWPKNKDLLALEKELAKVDTSGSSSNQGGASGDVSGNTGDEDIDLDAANKALDQLESMYAAGNPNYTQDAWDSAILPDWFPKEIEGTKTEYTEYDPKSMIFGDSYGGMYTQTHEDRSEFEVWSLSIEGTLEQFKAFDTAIREAGFYGSYDDREADNLMHSELLGGWSDGTFFVRLRGGENFGSDIDKEKYPFWATINVERLMYTLPEEIEQHFPLPKGGIATGSDSDGYMGYDDSYNESKDYESDEFNGTFSKNWMWVINSYCIPEEKVNAFLEELEADGFELTDTYEMEATDYTRQEFTHYFYKGQNRIIVTYTPVEDHIEVEYCNNKDFQFMN